MAESLRREIQQYLVRSRWDSRADGTGDRVSIKCQRSDAGMVQMSADGSALEMAFVVSADALPIVVEVPPAYPSRFAELKITSPCEPLLPFCQHLTAFGRSMSEEESAPLSKLLTEAAVCFHKLVNERDIARYLQTKQEQQQQQQQQSASSTGAPVLSVDDAAGPASAADGSAAAATATAALHGMPLSRGGLTPEDMPGGRVVRQSTQEYLDKVNSATRGPHTKMSSLRLLHDLKQLRRTDTAALGFRAQYVDDNLFHWQVRLLRLDDGPLAADLAAYARRCGMAEPHIELDLTFPPDYPFSPPFIRVKRPRFAPFSGIVSMGGTLALDALSPQSWSPGTDIVSVLVAVRQALLQDGGRVDAAADVDEYSLEEATAAMFRTARVLHEKSLPRAVGSFNMRLECYPPAAADRPDVERGGKTLLPASALEELARDPSIEFPWLFCLIAPNGARAYCGVQEFVAPEGKAFVPAWILRNLRVADGTPLTIRSVQLPRGTYVKLQPHSAEFLDLPNHKSALEQALMHHVTLMLGDTVRLVCEDRPFLLNVLDLRPDKVVSVIAEPYLDIQVEFAPPLSGLRAYEERQRERQRAREQSSRARDGAAAAEPAIPDDGVAYSVCANCRKPIPSATMERHVLFCQRNNFYCERCGRLMPAAERADHAREHEPVPCECGAPVERHLLEAHVDRDCPMRFVGCAYCGARVRANVKDAHELECGCKTDPCESCGCMVMRREFMIHLASGCVEGRMEASPRHRHDDDAEDDEEDVPEID